VKLVPRKAWGARPPHGDYTHIATTRGVKVHYTGMTVKTAPQHIKDCAPLVRQIQNDHMDNNGWIDIGYTALVCHHGYVFEGRGIYHLPAANGAGLNAGHYAVCGLVGDKGLVLPSDAMKNGIRDAIEWLRNNGGAGNEIKGHRDGYSTDCPGPKLYPWVQDGAPRPDGNPLDALWPGRLLKIATPMMHGQDVMQVQKWLKIEADGWYGPKTEAAVKAFQKAHGLLVDGIVGRVTWDAFAT
jgi:peptidoglycan hydrolase-like protein with peptidoglycan-binding domain